MPTPGTGKEVPISKQFFGTSHAPRLPVARAGDSTFVPGQVPGTSVAGGVAAEPAQAPENVTSPLAMAGRTFGAVVKTPALSRDREGFATFNAAQAEDFPTEPPARSVTESRLMLNPAAEIGAIAYKPA